MNTLALSLEETARFWAKVQISEDCWNWTAYISPQGYGKFRVAGAMRLAHRASYYAANGTIPDGLFVDHVCHNKACVNPSHLRLATNKQNQEHRRGAQSNSTSGVLGVSWRASRKKWHARVEHNGRELSLGLFANLADAEAAAVAKRLELFTHNDVDKIPA